MEAYCRERDTIVFNTGLKYCPEDSLTFQEAKNTLGNSVFYYQYGSLPCKFCKNWQDTPLHVTGLSGRQY